MGVYFGSDRVKMSRKFKVTQGLREMKRFVRWFRWQHLSMPPASCAYE